MVSDTYRLLGLNGFYYSTEKGTLGGNSSTKVYGRLDCPSALMWLKRGHYKKIRVFFENEIVAKQCGYRPCARCMPDEYKEWKSCCD